MHTGHWRGLQGRGRGGHPVGDVRHGGDGGGWGEEGAWVGGQEVVIGRHGRGGVGPVQQLWGEGGEGAGRSLGPPRAWHQGGEGVGGGGVQEAASCNGEL